MTAGAHSTGFRLYATHNLGKSANFRARDSLISRLPTPTSEARSTGAMWKRFSVRRERKAATAVSSTPRNSLMTSGKQSSSSMPTLGGHNQRRCSLAAAATTAATHRRCAGRRSSSLRRSSSSCRWKRRPSASARVRANGEPTTGDARCLEAAVESRRRCAAASHL